VRWTNIPQLSAWDAPFQRLGNSVGNSHGTLALILDRLLFRRSGLTVRVIRPKRGWLLSCVSGGGWPPTLLSQLLSAQPSSGHSWTLRRAASRITCPSTPTRVSPIPYTGHWQMNSSGPVVGSGHTHHRKS
jgi:hypothetical protein